MHDQLLSIDAAGNRGSPVPEVARHRPGAAIRQPAGRADAGVLHLVARDSGPETDANPTLDDATFREELLRLIPNLRAFSISLAGRNAGDDFAQDALAKAWKARGSFERGTNMKAWLFTILRNQFFSDKRRAWRNQPLEQGVAENTLVANDDPLCSEELLDVRNAMQNLPDEQREALILAGPAGLTYEETARICGCAVGTVKSRVSRARAALAVMLAEASIGTRSKSGVSSTRVIDDIMQSAVDIRRQLKMTKGV